MSKDAVASAYTVMLNDKGFRELVHEDPSTLDPWELTDDEKDVLLEEAGAEVSGFAIGFGPVMTHLSSGPPLSAPVASSLGFALNRAAGLPTGSLRGPGFASGAGCCPWGHAIVGMGEMQE
ncbi:MAG TPA: hypothetical protein VMT43_03845 [Acidimicrobiales bacterium]|nr:hypothetical protein [Acidimicrobiales bacterium]